MTLLCYRQNVQMEEKQPMCDICNSSVATSNKCICIYLSKALPADVTTLDTSRV